MKDMRKLSLLIMLLSMFMLTSCSVFMAAKKEGVSIDELSQCKTRTCLISKGAIPINSKKNEDGILIEETYQAQKPKGSAARAVMHGCLDVVTLGIWEVAGTPIEGSKGKKKMYSIKVYYENGENIKNIELVQ